MAAAEAYFCSDGKSCTLRSAVPSRKKKARGIKANTHCVVQAVCCHLGVKGPSEESCVLLWMRCSCKALLRLT